MLTWNPHIAEPTKSIYLCLVGIDESASKECGANLLDLLLRCDVLVQTTDGECTLADNWETRKVYFVGDAKTIENVTRFVMSYLTANVQEFFFTGTLERHALSW